MFAMSSFSQYHVKSYGQNHGQNESALHNRRKKLSKYPKACLFGGVAKLFCQITHENGNY